MAAHEGQNGTDTSSIRPVSSLRSRFEILGSPSDVGKSHAASLRTPSRLSQAAAGEPPLRASLDQPRLGTASSETWEEPGSISGGLNGAVTPRPRGGPKHPRPVSMGPTSPPTTPSVMIHSPQSPPRSSFQAQAEVVRSLGQIPPRPKSTGLVDPTFVPPVNTSHGPLGSSAQYSPNIGKKPKPPPPVNRSSKPSLPSTPASLAPKLEYADEGSVSPFSTPPGSPTSPESPPARVEFHPPPLHHKAQTRRQPLPAPGILPTSSDSPSNQDPSDQPHRRPNLPNRHPPRQDARAVSTPSPRQNQSYPNGLQHTQSVHVPRRKSPEPPSFHHSQSVRMPNHSRPPVRPSEAAKDFRKPSLSQTFLPPPKRITTANGPASTSQPARAPSKTFSEILPAPSTSGFDIYPQQQIRRVGTDGSDTSAAGTNEPVLLSADYPDGTQVNRRPPKAKYGVDNIWTHYDTRLLDLCGTRVCSSGYITKAWNVETGKMTLEQAMAEERDIKALSMVFKPGLGPENEGQVIWLGTNHGEIVEFDLRLARPEVNRRFGAHGRHEVIKMHRYQNTIWSIDDDLRLFVWLPDERGVPNLDVSPNSHRVAKGHTFSIIARDKLWYATGKEVRVYDPANGHERSFHVTQALSQPGTGDITSGAVLPTQLDRVYLGHSDGKVSIYSTNNYSCLGVVNVSTYKITTMAGVGKYIWAGFSTGWMYVYDTTKMPWKIKKEWKAHEGPIPSIVVDRSSVWKCGHLQVASLGLDNAVKIWDGMLEDDWMETRLHDHDVEFCTFREVKAVVVTWNAGASTPMDIRNGQRDGNFFREVIQPHDPPDILSFGFQELVDLEDKSLTAKNLFKGRHKKQNQDPEHMGHQYRAWRDYLARLIDETMPHSESYTLLQTGSLVGLFSCIFVKSALRSRIRDLETTEVKRGMGGLYGNKGAIMIRFVLDSTSLCFTNCHLAAGQKETLARNTDVNSILESSSLGVIRSPEHRIDCYVGGGDGTQIIDHEICIWNGDLNYRIDTMGRDNVVKTIKAGNLDRLLDRDQLRLSLRRHPGLRLRNFKEEKITFAPTYKYDVGTDNYDSSEKNRSPAWCDRVLYRGQGRVKMVDYRRHECRASDHRPVSGTFLMRIKSVVPEKRNEVWERIRDEVIEMKVEVAEDVKVDYLVNVLGCEPQEARRQLSG